MRTRWHHCQSLSGEESNASKTGRSLNSYHIILTILLGMCLYGCDNSNGKDDSTTPGKSRSTSDENNTPAANISFEAAPAPAGSKTYTGNGITFHYPEIYDKVEAQDHGFAILIKISKTAGEGDLLDPELLTIGLLKPYNRTADSLAADTFKEFLKSHPNSKRATKNLLGVEAVGFISPMTAGGTKYIAHYYFLNLQHIERILDLQYTLTEEDGESNKEIRMVVDSLRGAKQ